MPALLFALLLQTLPLDVAPGAPPGAKAARVPSPKDAACYAHARDLAIIARYFLTVSDYVTLQMIVTDFAKQPDLVDAWITERGVHVAHSDRAMHGRPSDPRYVVGGEPPASSVWSVGGSTIVGVPIGQKRGDAFVRCRLAE